ncbi:DUF6867 family protein [Bartonella sp. HY406]|uniref:DUF6867 family protein n=1 Tax=Bartonella sp. HY406 TaxID=2979331 RepID=UPI0021C72EB6|nr:hypothetical protein [Bartonella sp. HY406]UXN03683.1 hypothetical protein N6B01_01145 [Bartonella sp. HY406]
MRGILFEQSSIVYFLIITVILGGGAAWMTGRACALTWRNISIALAYMVLLAVAIRFLHYVIPYYEADNGNITYHATFLSLHYYLVDLVVMLIFCALGYRHTRVNQMVRQYSWLYKKTSPLSYSEK